MKKIVTASALLLLGLHLFFVWKLAAPQAAMVREVLPGEEIPHDYQSWSLFLICNPAWIVQDPDERLIELYRQYRAFGDAIGPKNVAIWFWKEGGPFDGVVIPERAIATSLPGPSAKTDISRSAEYCEKFKLLPSKSPYVLVTTRHPDAQEVGDYFLVSLNGLPPKDSTELLARLTDQLLVTGLDQPSLDASTRWQRQLAAVLAVVSSVGSYFNEVSFTFNTGFFKAEIAHSVK